MKKKSETPVPMTDYEVDAMWMSYRYAIGRHTIAACMHAGNMISEIYHRLEEKRIPFTVYDIRREINQHLEWDFNFGMNLYVRQEDYDPIKALVEFAKRDDVKKAGGIFKYLSNNRELKFLLILIMNMNIILVNQFILVKNYMLMSQMIY